MKTLTTAVCALGLMAASQSASANEVTDALSATISAQVDSFIIESKQQIKQSTINMLSAEWEKLVAMSDDETKKEEKKPEQSNEQ